MKFNAQEAAELERIALAHGGKVVANPVRIPGETPDVMQSTVQTKRPRQNVLQAAVQGPCQSIWIPGWFPGLLNQWDGRHWSKRAKIKKADRDIVQFYFVHSGIACAAGPRRVSAIFILPKGKRLFDRDAPWKSLKDSLVDCGALVDDTPRLCIDGSVSYARALLDAQPGTILLLEDV